MIKATIFEAKTNLSSLLQHALKGESVIITTGREKTLIARLAPLYPIAPQASRRTPHTRFYPHPRLL